jgi:AsmA protein
MKSIKKWIVGTGATLGLLLGLALIIPFLIDFSHFKPQIQEVVSGAVNAKVDFTSARLQILPGLGVKIKSVTVENTDPVFNGTKLFSVDEIFFQTELMPLLQKQFRGEILIAKPEIVMARKGLQNNLAALAKPSTEPQPETPAPEDKAPADPKAQEDLMKMIKESVVMKSVRIRDAGLRIQDIGVKSEPVKVTDFNLNIENIGLERDINILLSTVAKVSEAGARVSGPIEIKATTNAKVGAAGLELATFSGKVDLDRLDINVMDAFLKPSGTALNLTFAGNVASNSAAIESLTFNLHNLAVNSTVTVSDLKTLNTSAKVNVRNDELVKLGDLLPQHKNLLQSASLNLDASVDGPLSAWQSVKASVDLATKLTGSDFATSVKVNSIEPINVSLAANSTRLDLGAILKPFMPPPSEKPEGAPSTSPPASPEASPVAGGEPAPEKEFELSPEIKKMLAGSDINVNVDLKEILFDKLQITNFVIKAGLKGLEARLDPFAMNAFGGAISATGSVDLGASPIKFAQNFTVNEVKADEFIGFAFPEHRELLKGKLSLGLAASGAGTTKTSISKTLNGKGDFNVKEAQLNTTSVAESMQKEFDGFVSGLSITGAAGSAFDQAEKILANPLLDKIPGVAAQKPDLGKMKAKYASFSGVKIAGAASVEKTMKDVKGALEIKDGRIHITSNDASGGGAMAFAGSVGIDSTLGGKATFTASEATKNNLLKQSQYAALMFDANRNLVLNMNLSGLVNDPKVSLDTAAIRQNFETNAKSLVDKEVKKAAEEFVNKALKGQKDAVEAELRKKAAELKAQADAARQQAEAKAAEATKQAEEQARKKAEEEAKKKGGEAAKNKLKGLIGK